MPLPYPYPYDPLGTAPTNLITNESATVVPPVDPEQANFIVPVVTPFYGNTVVLRTGPLNTDPELIEGTDYQLAHHFVEASDALGQPVYGSILFIDQGFNQTIYMTYQTLGGPYTLGSTAILTDLTRSLYSIRFVTFTQIVGLVAAFPPRPHPLPMEDTTTYGDLITAVQALTAAITAQGGDVPALVTAFTQHLIAATSHTKGQVGLSNVPNWPPATGVDLDPPVTNKFMTPAMTAAMIGLLIQGASTSTAGLAKIAELSDVHAGTGTDTYVTPSALADVLANYQPL